MGRFAPLWRPELPALNVVALLLAGMGLALAGWAILWFVRRRTPIEPHETPTCLIVEGPFRLNRNPIYSAMTLLLLALALWNGALSALLTVGLFPWVITRRFIHHEERALRDVFGAQAERYFARTRRW
ncbi:methyltransferase family protein [Kushneria indalinina]|uniref:Phospholipid methyltransferase n=1 Tax=Kushneria indalinina DSM 14324 TaxID=1122140 RepID=A0A3D9DV37_9GAMM|nr:methyltransferase [Kushneria indalinina]REC94650.1 phospholipid methyltransferase [Kushneria indalinina DSM 14324]